LKALADKYDEFGLKFVFTDLKDGAESFNAFPDSQGAEEGTT